MYVLSHFDWYGSIEELTKLEEGMKKVCEGIDGIKFLGRFGPHNKKFHWTWFFKSKDMGTWEKLQWPEGYERDYKILTHQVNEYYESV